MHINAGLDSLEDVQDPVQHQFACVCELSCL